MVKYVRLTVREGELGQPDLWSKSRVNRVDIFVRAVCAHQRKVCTMWVQLFVPHVSVIHTTKSRVAVLCLSVLLVVSHMLRDTLSVRSLSLHGGLVHKLTVSVTHPIHCYSISCAHSNRS